MKLTLIVATFCLHFLPYEVLGSAPYASEYCPTHPNDQDAAVYDDAYTNCTYWCEVGAAPLGLTCESRELLAILKLSTRTTW